MKWEYSGKQPLQNVLEFTYKNRTTFIWQTPQNGFHWYTSDVLISKNILRMSSMMINMNMKPKDGPSLWNFREGKIKVIDCFCCCFPGLLTSARFYFPQLFSYLLPPIPTYNRGRQKADFASSSSVGITNNQVNAQALQLQLSSDQVWIREIK